MLTHQGILHQVRSFGTAAVALALLCLLAAPASAQTADVRYARALERERAARAAATPNVATLRSIAVSYESIVRRYPRSGYCDNALWQAAGLLELAWETGGARRDRDQAVRLLTWLRREYPTSSLARQAGSRVTALNRSQAPASRNAAAAPAPARPAAGSTGAAAGAARRTTADRPAATTPQADETTTAAAGRTDSEAAVADIAETRLTSPPAAASAAGESAPVRPAEARPAETRAVAPASTPNRTELLGLSHTPLPRGDRVTLELTAEGRYTVERLNAPDELTITLPDARTAAAIVDAAASIRGDRIRNLKLRQGERGVQVIVQLEGHPRLSEFPLYAPYRLVLDLESEPEPSSTPAAAASTAAPVQQPDASVVRESSAHVPAAPATTAVVANVSPAASRTATKPAPATPSAASTAAETPAPSRPAPPSITLGGGYSLARQLGLGVSRIVIDPGHGGSDPGASANGVTEADLVLDVALRLEKLLLAQPGFEVVLTRRTSQAVPLARRTAIANQEAADLFLSIHANSSPRTQTAGVETYYLNFASNPQAEAVAARENASSPQAMHSLPELVRAIAMNNKLEESRELAGAVQTSLVRRLRERNRQFQDLGVKQAPFVVLIGAQMPSVLAEIAFLTNRQEASLLRQNAYKQQIAQALCDAILRYQGSLKKTGTVAASTEGR
jgi:N-acetylmuramoyl-L-alanine amidase